MHAPPPLAHFTSVAFPMRKSPIREISSSSDFKLQHHGVSSSSFVPQPFHATALQAATIDFKPLRLQAQRLQAAAPSSRVISSTATSTATSSSANSSSSDLSSATSSSSTYEFKHSNFKQQRLQAQRLQVQRLQQRLQGAATLSTATSSCSNFKHRDFKQLRPHVAATSYSGTSSSSDFTQLHPRSTALHAEKEGLCSLPSTLESFTHLVACTRLLASTTTSTSRSHRCGGYRKPPRNAENIHVISSTSAPQGCAPQTKMRRVVW
eukprot:3397679-Amphidinium_carterae.2